MAAVPEQSRGVPRVLAGAAPPSDPRYQLPLSRSLLAVAATTFLVVINPAVWHSGELSWWYPPVGLGLTLTAWFGWRAGLLMLAAGAITAAFVGTEWANGWAVLHVLGEAAASSAEAVFGWWLFHDRLRGGRRLNDPRSASMYLLVVAGLAAALGPAVELLLSIAVGAIYSPSQFLALWLSHSLALLVVAPPLLITATAGLIRARLTSLDAPDSAPLLPGPIGADRMTRGDWIEATGLAFGAAGLGLLLALAPPGRDLASWQSWGSPILLIVWASLRQGQCGGSLVASASIVTALLALPVSEMSESARLLLQGHLVAQAGTALLVAATASWLRASERRYRQLVAHVPIVVYSARLVGTPPEPEITLVSAASGVLLDCPPDVLLGPYATWLEHVHPDDRELLRAARIQMERQKEAVVCEYRLASRIPIAWQSDADGWKPDLNPSATLARARARGIRWVRDTLAPNRDADGRVTGWEGVVSDITEPRMLADDLRRTSNMLHALVSNLPAGVFFVQRPEGRPILINARARQLLGPREDVALEHISTTYRLHRPDGSLYPAEELPVTLALRQSASTMKDDIVVHHADGHRVPLVTWAAPVKLGGNMPDAAVWVLEDLTGLKQAEASRRDTERRFRTAIETMGEALIVQDKQGLITEANPAAGRLFGMVPGELRGKSVVDIGWEFLSEAGTPLSIEEYPHQVVLLNGKPVRNAVIGFRRTSQAGMLRCLLVNAMPLGAQPAGVVTTFADVTDYREAREGVRISEARYRGLVESLPQPLLQFDDELTLIYANAALQNVMGYTQAQLGNPRALANIIHPASRNAIRNLLRSALAGQTGQIEFRYKAGDGSDRVACFLSQPRFVGGKIDGVIALIVDVTRERALEVELQQTRRHELIGRLAVGMAHNFNNHLTVVLAHAELAFASLSKDAGARQDLERIAEGAKRAASLAARIQVFARQRPGPTRPVAVYQLIEQTIDLLRNMLPRALDLSVHCEGNEIFVAADESRLEEALIHLCLLIRDAIPRNGVMRIHAGMHVAPSQPAGADGRLWLLLTMIGAEPESETASPNNSTRLSIAMQASERGLEPLRQIVEECGGKVSHLDLQPPNRIGYEVWLPQCDAPVGSATSAELTHV